MSYLPPQNDPMAIFSVIADPENAKKRMQELAEATNALNESIEESRVVARQTDEDRKAAEQALADVRKERADNEAFVKERDAEFEEQKYLLNKRFEEVTTTLDNIHIRDDQSKQREYSLAVKEAELIQREKAVASLEKDVGKRSDALSKNEQAYETRVKKLKAALE